METPEFINTITNNPKDPYKKNCKYRFCPKKEFTADRLNQEYCCYDHKKYENNFKAKAIRDKTKGIDYIQKKNRKILENFYNSGKTKAFLSELELEGFDYQYHTHARKDIETNSRIAYYFEYGLIYINSSGLKMVEIIQYDG